MEELEIKVVDRRKEVVGTFLDQLMKNDAKLKDLKVFGKYIVSEYHDEKITIYCEDSKGNKWEEYDEIPHQHHDCIGAIIDDYDTAMDKMLQLAKDRANAANLKGMQKEICIGNYTIHLNYEGKCVGGYKKGCYIYTLEKMELL